VSGVGVRRSVARISAALLMATAAVAANRRPLSAQEGYRVIVNAANELHAASRRDVARMFLKQLTQWPDGAPVQPVNLPQRAEVRDRFCRALLDRSSAAIQAYWQNQVFSGREVPPVEQATDADVVRFVESNATAIGYVSAKTPLPADVRALTLTDAGDADVFATVFRDDAVEQPPVRIAMPAVRYPATLRELRISGSVVIEFVVDEAGRVRGESVVVREATNDVFAAAAKEAVVGERFRPGRVRGRAVRVLVQQVIRFDPSGRS
jgi:TonB family protein